MRTLSALISLSTLVSLSALTQTALCDTGRALGYDFTALDASGNAIAPGSHDCVRDGVTGLIWSTETFDATWAGATSAAASYSRCGHATGWRLPTRHELLSIVHYGANGPALDATYFPGRQSPWYWTSDAFTPGSMGTWYVDMDGGYGDAYRKAGPYHVRLVRGGE